MRSVTMNDCVNEIYSALFQAISALPYLEFPHKRTLIVAYSGGKDSHVLLHALHALSSQHSFSIKAYHAHHGLSLFADDWARHCQTICNDLQIPLEIFKLALHKQAGDSLEALARNARYQAFAAKLEVGDLVLTAHSEEDQAETVLLNLLRGTGLRGLSGIHLHSDLGKGSLLRPMLTVSRKSIMRYAAHFNLRWIEDESNLNLQFKRNLIRKNLLPVLDSVNPTAAHQLAKCARLAFESQMLLEEYLHHDLQEILDGQLRLELNGLVKHAIPKRKALLRLWIKNADIPLPTEKKLMDILVQVFTAAQDKNPTIQWKGGEIRRYQNKLFLKSISDKQLVSSVPATQQPLTWYLGRPLALAQGQVWRSIPTRGKGLALKHFSLNPSLTVAFRQEGERCQLAGKNHTQSLKQLFQTLKIPPWERDSVPLFYHDGQLISVGDYCVSNKYRVTAEDEAGLLLTNK
ncbi:tRNA lysidine(34) synthetase TilS [Candidatus Berkiella cookevillensis]|uniref:tRNA(Ile)-lysidine synthase n=2 Tax=Candidatus Berkiella cookevillensis TaxID=437022 RepID=A0AAE3L753_9GAMM|nr:tRNA lysidine(34) synthetase TilS [Candidatus Berkiella cookevillensis]MCS5708379.1 tRNA lysidine(34) synthetase TilS [Candidatus Berkiella cookevillensis]